MLFVYLSQILKIMEFNLKKNSIDIGLKLGTILFIITALLYIYDLKYFYNGIQSGICIPIILGFGIYSILNAKKLNNQSLSFKQAFTAYFACIVIGYLLASIGEILIFEFIDPKAGKLINEELILQTKNSYEVFPPEYKPSDEFIRIQIENMQQNPRYSFYSVFMQYIFTLMINAFIGLIPALILKKS